MSPQLLWVEVAKLVLQLVGALGVARLTVHWALGRYKTEKTWERKLTAYIDVLTAVSEMPTVSDQWHDDELLRRDRPNEHDIETADRYKVAKRKLDESAAIALLLLSEQTQETLKTLNLELSKRADSLEEHLDNQSYALKQAQIQLVKQGQAALRRS